MKRAKQEEEFIGNDVPSSLHSLIGTFGEALVHKMPSLDLKGNKLSFFPRYLERLPCLECLLLANNRLERIPSIFVTRSLSTLRVLDLSHNSLWVLEDVLALGDLAHLEELHLEGNPLPLLHNRIFFLEALLVSNDNCFARRVDLSKFLPTDPSLMMSSVRPRGAGPFPSLQCLNHVRITWEDIHQSLLENRTSALVRLTRSPIAISRKDNATLHRGPRNTTKTINLYASDNESSASEEEEEEDPENLKEKKREGEEEGPRGEDGEVWEAGGRAGEKETRAGEKKEKKKSPKGIAFRRAAEKVKAGAGQSPSRPQVSPLHTKLLVSPEDSRLLQVALSLQISPPSSPHTAQLHEQEGTASSSPSHLPQTQKDQGPRRVLFADQSRSPRTSGPKAKTGVRSGPAAATPPPIPALHSPHTAAAGGGVEGSDKAEGRSSGRLYSSFSPSPSTTRLRPTTPAASGDTTLPAIAPYGQTSTQGFEEQLDVRLRRALSRNFYSAAKELTDTRLLLDEYERVLGRPAGYALTYEDTQQVALSRVAKDSLKLVAPPSTASSVLTSGSPERLQLSKSGSGEILAVAGKDTASSKSGSKSGSKSAPGPARLKKKRRSRHDLTNHIRQEYSEVKHTNEAMFGPDGSKPPSRTTTDGSLFTNMTMAEIETALSRVQFDIADNHLPRGYGALLHVDRMLQEDAKLVAENERIRKQKDHAKRLHEIKRRPFVHPRAAEAIDTSFTERELQTVHSLLLQTAADSHSGWGGSKEVAPSHLPHPHGPTRGPSSAALFGTSANPALSSPSPSRPHSRTHTLSVSPSQPHVPPSPSSLAGSPRAVSPSILYKPVKFKEPQIGKLVLPTTAPDSRSSVRFRLIPVDAPKDLPPAAPEKLLEASTNMRRNIHHELSDIRSGFEQFRQEAKVFDERRSDNLGLLSKYITQQQMLHKDGRVEVSGQQFEYDTKFRNLWNT